MQGIGLVLSGLLLLGSVACTDEDRGASPAGGFAAAGEFALTGLVEAVQDDAELPAGVEVSPPPSPQPTAGTAPDPGALDVTVETGTEMLDELCGVEASERITVFWVAGTRFEPVSVLADEELADDLEDRRVAVEGTIFVQEDLVEASPDADTSPNPAATDRTTTCALVAEQVEVERATAGTGTAPAPARSTASPAGPTPAATVRARTPAPTPFTTAVVSTPGASP
jgi:hypothetical protein